MNRRCPNCRFRFHPANSAEGRGLFRSSFRCPKCDAVLKQDNASSRTSGIGGLIALVGIVMFESDWAFLAPYAHTWWIWFAIGLIIAIVGATRARWVPVDSPSSEEP